MQNETNTTAAKFKNAREFGMAILQGPVAVNRVGRRQQNIAASWLKQGQIIEVGGFYKLA